MLNERVLATLPDAGESKFDQVDQVDQGHLGKPRSRLHFGLVKQAIIPLFLVKVWSDRPVA